MEPTATRSSIGEAPALAETDIELWTEFLGDYIAVWLRNSRQFIEDQQEKMYHMALCPFLFGVSRNLPQAWLEVLRIYGVIDKDRENRTSPLSEVELETLDMAETIFMRCSQLVSNKNDLKTILNFIYDVEDRSSILGRIDITYALQEVAGLEVFVSMWAPIKRFYEKRKRQAQVCIIYYFKIISYHVTQYGQNGADRFAYLESVIFDPLRSEWLDSVTLEVAKKTVADGNYRLAVEQYSFLIEREPFNCYLYSQRGEAYLLLCDYWAALSDCRRSIALELRNSLHYYRAAKVYLELGQLEKAEDLNHQSLEYSDNPCEREQIEQQANDIQARKRMTKFRETPASSGSEERDNYYIQYRKLMCEGSELYLSHHYNRAAQQFKAALDVRATSQELAVKGDDLALLYVYGLSCVKTEHTRNVQVAIEKFNAIISQTETFPAAFYGLALAYMVLNRYKEAGNVLMTGLARLRQCGDITVCHWPGTNTVIEDTVGPTLKRLMEDLLKETMFPPKPDAVCKFHVDTDSLKKEMYFSDPDYKGHVCIKCRADCSIDFHVQCWRPTDGNSRTKHNWKEVLDTPCPTPGCWGTVSEVYICRPAPDKTLRLSSQMEMRLEPNKPRPKLKMKTGSLYKLERKLELKKLRKERRQEARQLLQDQQADEEQLENVSTKIILPPEDDPVNIHLGRTGTVLHKDEPELAIEKKQKANKSKKKEKKQKQFLAVDVQFKGDENKERYGINSLDNDGDVVDVPPIFGLLPTPASEQPSTVTSKSPSHEQPALEIALYEYFYKILIAKGPLDLLSTELEEHTQNLTEEAQAHILSYGGLGSFLADHRQFHVSKNKTVNAIPASLMGNPPLRPKVNPSLLPHTNPWETKQPKHTDARSGHGHGLNPGAKEFVPLDKGTAHARPTDKGTAHARPTDQDELTDRGAAGVQSENGGKLPAPAGVKLESSEELPAPADDEGFTPVVNKRRTNTQKLPWVIQPNVPKLGLLKAASSINSLDEVQLDSQLPKRIHQPSNVLKLGLLKAASSINSLDEVQLDSQLPKRIHQPSNVLKLGLLKAESSISSLDEIQLDSQLPKKIHQPSNVPKLGLLKAASSISSLDEIQLDSQLPKRIHRLSISSWEGDKDKVDEVKFTNVLRRNMDSQDVLSHDFLETQSHARKGARELKTGVWSPAMNKPGPGSDVSDVSRDDPHHRVSSPALSTNSGSSSGRAESFLTGSQTSGQQTSLRPLKAPSIVLPTRGKNKRMLGSKMHTHQQPPSAGSSQVNDRCEEESVSSTASDRDSSWGDARAASSDRLHMPLVPGISGQDGTRVVSEPVSLRTSSGQGAFPSQAKDSSVDAQCPRNGLEKDVIDGPEGIITSSQGFAAGFQGWKMWPDSLAAEKLPQDSSVGDLKMPVKSGNFAVERPEKNGQETFDNWPFQAPAQQRQSQMFGHLTGSSEKQSAGNVKSVPDVTWPVWDWSVPRSYKRSSNGSEDDLRVPPSNPWQHPAPFHADLHRESPELHTTSTHAHTADVSHLLSNRDDDSGIVDFRPFSREFGLFGSGKVKDADPWPSRSVDSHTSLTTDITFHGHRSLVSPFPAWLNVEDQSSSTDPTLQSTSVTEPSLYTTDLPTRPPVYTTDLPTEPSVYTTDLPTEPSVSTTDVPTEPPGTITEQLSLKTDTSSESLVRTSLSKTSQNRSVIEPSSAPSFPEVDNVSKHQDKASLRTIDHRIAQVWELDQLDRGNMDPPAAQLRTVDCQTSLSAVQIDELLVSTNMLQDSRAQLASTLHEKLELQELLSLEKSLRGQLKIEYSRLQTRVYTAEASAQKWRDDYSQLIATDQQLTAQVRAQTETISKLVQQLDMYKTAYSKAQMDVLAMKKELVTSKIEVKQQEALFHFQRLSSVIAQAKKSQLPDSVYEKQTEFSEYVATCDRLSKHIQVVYLRLAGDLQRGLPVDLSELELSPPEFPKSPLEPSDRPQAPASSLPHIDYANRVHPSPPCSMASLHSSPPRGRSSIHSSPSHRGSPMPHSLSSMHSSPSRSRPSSRTSPSRSIASVHSSPQPSRASIPSSPPPGRDHQKTAWSASRPEAQPQETEDEDEDEDADAYLKMIYGGYSDSVSEVATATAASRPHPGGVHHKQTETLGRQGWNPASSRLLSSPAQLTTPSVRASQSVPDHRALPGHRLSKLTMEATRTASVPTVRQQLGPHTSHTGPEQSKQQVPYFERIVQTVQDQLPGCSRNEIQKIIDTLRRESGGSLSGWTFESLANTVLDMILDLQQEQNLATFADGDVPDVRVTTSKMWTYQTPDLTCSICQCAIEPREALTLSCGHTFHEMCGQKWLTNDRSCPNCRSHALLPQDFPALE